VGSPRKNKNGCILVRVFQKGETTVVEMDNGVA
jgi:hypothetical protein